MDENKTDLNYQLGWYVGSHIYWEHLLTISTDSLKTRKVIQVSDDDTKEFDRIFDEYRSTCKNFGGGHELGDINKWDIHLKNMTELHKKYLPHELECYLNPIVFADESIFKDGIRDYLWNSDLCNYKLNTNDDVKIESNVDGYFTKVTLYLDI